jgi:hypothetical protein
MIGLLKSSLSVVHNSTFFQTGNDYTGTVRAPRESWVFGQALSDVSFV